MFKTASRMEKEQKGGNSAARTLSRSVQRINRPQPPIQLMEHMKRDSESIYDHTPTQYDSDLSTRLNNLGHTVQQRLGTVRTVGTHFTGNGNNVVQRCGGDYESGTPNQNPPANDAGDIRAQESRQNVQAIIPRPLPTALPRLTLPEARASTDNAIFRRIGRIDREENPWYIPVMICAVVDLTTHRVYIGYSGANYPNPTRIRRGEMTEEISNRLEATRTLARNRPRSDIPANTRTDSFEVWRVNNCAEVQAANIALRHGALIQNLYINTRRYSTGELAPPCRNCERTFDGIPGPQTSEQDESHT